MRRTPSSLDEVIDALALQMPRSEARTAVRRAAQARGLHDIGLDIEQVLLLFDDLASSDRLVGVCARFAKARVLLASGLDREAAS